MLTIGSKKRKTRRGTRKGMRRKGAKRAGLRLAYDGGKKYGKSTRKGMRRKTARRAYMKGGTTVCEHCDTRPNYPGWADVEGTPFEWCQAGVCNHLDCNDYFHAGKTPQLPPCASK